MTEKKKILQAHNFLLWYHCHKKVQCLRSR